MESVALRCTSGLAICAASLGALSLGSEPCDTGGMLSSLPELCCTRIAHDVRMLDTTGFSALRISCKTWKTICDTQLTSTLEVDQLADAVQSFNSLPSLKLLPITAKHSTAFLVNASEIIIPSLTSEYMLNAYMNPGLTKENLGKLVLPWDHSLSSLYSKSYDVAPNQDGSVRSEGFFVNFPQLTSLKFLNTQATLTLDTLNLAGCRNLKELACPCCHLVSLHVNECTNLTDLNCLDNLLTALEVGRLCNLGELVCNGNRLTALQLSSCLSLHTFCCTDNQLATLDLSLCTCLTNVMCEGNLLEELHLLGCTALRDLDCQRNVLTSLILPECTPLKELTCQNNSLTSINESACVALQDLKCCEDNLQGGSDSSLCSRLRRLDCRAGNLSSIDVSACNSLTSLLCNFNNLSRLDLSAFTNLKELECTGNRLTRIDLPAELGLNSLCYEKNEAGHMYTYIVSHSYIADVVSCDARPRSLSPPLCSVSRPQTPRLGAQHVVASIVKEGFAGSKEMCKLQVRAGHMSSIDLTMCDSVEVDLYCTVDTLKFLGRNTVWRLAVKGVFCLSGLDGFTSLRDLFCDAEDLPSLDLSMCSLLQKVELNNSSFFCMLGTINLQGCSLLEELQCNNFPSLVELELSECTALRVLSCVASGLRSLDVSSCLQLESLDVCSSDQLEWVARKSSHWEKLDFKCEGCSKLRHSV